MDFILKQVVIYGGQLEKKKYRSHVLEINFKHKSCCPEKKTAISFEISKALIVVFRYAGYLY